MDTASTPEKTSPEVLLPEKTETLHKNASWGAIISIVVILTMIVVGAFYAWGQRVAEEHNLPATTTNSRTY